MTKAAPEVETILDDIERALAAGCYYVAIQMALALPDVCAALGAPNGWTSPDKYKAWYNAHLAPDYENLTAADCYSLRCSVVHQGRLGRPGMQYSRIVFTLPGRNILHCNILNDALNLDAVTFCRDVVAATRRWLDLNKGDPIVQKNLPMLIQYRPNGSAPYIIGEPIIC